jgi:hypothetical protein
LLKNEFVQTTWHIAVNNCHVEVIQKFWDLAKKLQLIPEELNIICGCQ